MKFDLSKCKSYTFEDLCKSINLAQELYNSKDFLQAYPLIKDACQWFDMMAYIHFQGDNLNIKHYRGIYKLAGDICSELRQDKEALKYYIKHQFFNFQFNHDFANYNELTLFQFRNTRNYTFSNLENNEITLVDPQIQNDIVDSPIFSWLETLCDDTSLFERHHKPYIDSFKYIRATSFCADSENMKAVENSLMWAHYANCHKGICVQYKLGKKDFASTNTKYAVTNRLVRIKYSDPNNPNEAIDFTNSDTSLTIRNAIANKSVYWKYENEVRLVAYTPYEESKYVQCKLETPNPIRAIFFGVRCKTQTKNRIRCIFKDRPDVEFFQMKVNPKNIHKLIYEPC